MGWGELRYIIDVGTSKRGGNQAATQGEDHGAHDRRQVRRAYPRCAKGKPRPTQCVRSLQTTEEQITKPKHPKRTEQSSGNPGGNPELRLPRQRSLHRHAPRFPHRRPPNLQQSHRLPPEGRFLARLAYPIPPSRIQIEARRAVVVRPQNRSQRLSLLSAGRRPRQRPVDQRLKFGRTLMLYKIYMNEYFSAIEVHLEDRCLLDAVQNPPLLASLGVDCMLFTLAPNTPEEHRHALETANYSAIALAPDHSHCLLAHSNTLSQFSLANATPTKLMETQGLITALRYAPTQRYIAVGSEEGKTTLYEPTTGRKEKCRPGHVGAVSCVFTSADGEFVGSIGSDQYLLIYRYEGAEQPQEVARFLVTSLSDCRPLSASFHFTLRAVFAGGQPQVQRIELLDGKWEHTKCSSMSHPTEVLAVEVFKANVLASSSAHEVCIWSIREGEKLFEIEQFSLTRMVALSEQFYGVRDDGKIYHFKRQIASHQPMEIEDAPSRSEDRIEFEEASGEEGEEEQATPQEEEKVYQHKKSKADKMITCFTQPPLANSTQFFDGNRFLFVNAHGCVIQREEGDDEVSTEVEFESERRKTRVQLPRGRKPELFDMNQLLVLWATENEFGVRVSQEGNFENWEASWNGIQAVVLGSNWLAVANDDTIRIMDLCGHEIKSIAFDRQVIALRAHENLLAVAYHEGVPMWGSQQMSLQLYLVDQPCNVLPLANVHLPLRPGSLLKWLSFSREGMLFSQDTSGNIRVLSLQTSEWTPLSLEGGEDSRKVWPIAVANYHLIYWKTSSEDPEPTVAPRFSPHTAAFTVPTVGTHPENTQPIYEQLLWKRLALDHEKARSKLWGRLKVGRSNGSHFLELSQSILSEREIALKQVELDEQYYQLVENYLKKNETIRAMQLATSCIRSIEAGRKLVDLFDYYNRRNLAIQLEEHYEQRQKQLDYELTQNFHFMKLREEAEKYIQPRSQDPMRRSTARKINDPIPSFSQNFSQSQQSMEFERVNSSQASAMKSHVSEANDNPFLKRKSTHESLEAKKKEITEQVEKFGIKKKAEERNVARRPNKDL